MKVRFHQGSLLSPSLFSLAMENVTGIIGKGEPRCTVYGVWCYDDDNVPCGEAKDEMGGLIYKVGYVIIAPQPL